MKVRFAVSPAGSSATGPELCGFASAVEAAGFDGVWLSDIPLSSVLDPLLGLALIAGRTERLRLGANVVPLGRNPVLLAKELAQLDQLSGGRLLLSFVPGIAHPHEAAVMGTVGAARGAVLEESLGLMRQWWDGSAVEASSSLWSFPGVESVARPVQDPLEVWLGGRGPKALERVGRIADGWLGAAVTAGEAPLAVKRILEAALGAGRQFDAEHFGLSIPYARSEVDGAVLEGMRSRRSDVDPLELLPVGAAALRELVLAHVEAGLSKFVLRPSGAVESWEDEMAWLAEAVLDLQT